MGSRLGAKGTMVAGAFYHWTCVVAAEVTFLGPPEGLRTPPAICTGYRNSHLRLDGLEDIDCLAIVCMLDRDPLRREETRHVQMEIRMPAERPDQLDDALQVGKRFCLLHVGYRIATGTIAALLDPPMRLPA